MAQSEPTQMQPQGQPQMPPKTPMGLRNPMVFYAAQMGPDHMRIIAEQLAMKAPARGKGGYTNRPMWGRGTPSIPTAPTLPLPPAPADPGLPMPGPMQGGLL